MTTNKTEMTHHYLVYFRRRRGGMGIPYDLAHTEFTAIFANHNLIIKHEHIPKHRMWVILDLSPKEIQLHAQNLAYTEAILSQHIEPYGGQTITPIERGRWHIGWVRQGNNQIYQEEAFVQNILQRRQESPDQQTFPIYKNGKLIAAKGYHTRRALSAMDARFLFNIAHLQPNARILDPFAGFGGIIREAHRRNITIFASDIDPTLSMGLHNLALQTYTLADARSLPHPSHIFDAIITEPPFHPTYQHAVYDALPELMRVLKPNGKLMLLIAQNMCATIQSLCDQLNLNHTHIATIPRDHGLRCSVRLIQSLTH
ncbi:MAG: TRM11 family SAM-dependent methyltransferase [Candidatus Latescibacterota bacterium]